ncbi:TPA: YhcH/YjgK/YiaL family protein [Kluyvera cryocrescens]|nr:YhcH/YjgK/YiaL family protein [Kluyvera cryocrescens]
MISGNIQQLPQAVKELPAEIYTVLENIANFDWRQHQDGQLEIDGIVYKTFTADTVTAENRRPETHKKFIDVQYVITGNEWIEFAGRGGSVPQEVNPLQDNYFYQRESLSLNDMLLRAGDYVIFFPWDIHAPLCHKQDPQRVRKMVVKVPFETL